MILVCPSEMQKYLHNAAQMMFEKFMGGFRVYPLKCINEFRSILLYLTSLIWQKETLAVFDLKILSDFFFSFLFFFFPPGLQLRLCTVGR